MYRNLDISSVDFVVCLEVFYCPASFVPEHSGGRRTYAVYGGKFRQRPVP